LAACDCTNDRRSFREIPKLQAGTVPFANTKAERLAKGDPRLSLEERYGSLSRYYSLAVEAANKLIAEWLLLPEDADHELRQLLTDLSRNGALPLRGREPAGSGLAAAAAR
jgi:hypothetical protein